MPNLPAPKHGSAPTNVQPYTKTHNENTYIKGAPVQCQSHVMVITTTDDAVSTQPLSTVQLPNKQFSGFTDKFLF